MTFDPFLSAPPLIQVHALAALLALTLGPVALYRTRRDLWHRLTGRVWVAAMGAAALSGLAIPSTVLPVAFGLGPIHLLSVLALVSLWRGVAAIRRGQIARHRAFMRSLYWNAIGIAGLFTLLPGRLMNEVLFPGLPMAGLAVVGTGGLALALRAARGVTNPLPFARWLR